MTEMTLAHLIMLGLGLIAFAVGAALLARSGVGGEGARYARRIAGTMLAALGIILTIFALGLDSRPNSLKPGWF